MARFTKSTIPTVEQIESLALEAAGNQDKLKELGALAEKLGRRANQNLRELEKKSFESEAYKQAQYRTGKEKPRYSQAHTGSAAALAESAIQAAAFLRYKTSTVGGVREKAGKGFKKLMNTIKSRFKDGTPEQKKMSMKQIESSFDKFLKSGAFEELRNVYGSPIIEATAEKIEQGANVEDLLKVYEQYINGDFEGGILTVWDNWIKGE